MTWATLQTWMRPSDPFTRSIDSMRKCPGIGETLYAYAPLGSLLTWTAFTPAPSSFSSTASPASFASTRPITETAVMNEVAHSGRHAASGLA